MKKSFLVFGVLGALCVVNGYANDTVAQESTGVTVARAAKVSPKVKKSSYGVKLLAPQIQEKTASGVVGITCPAGCTPNCAVMSNIVLCECKDGNGNACAEEVVQSSASTTER